MENLCVNLDDGELWIPSDILPKEEVHHHRPHCRRGRNNRTIANGGGSSLDDPSRQSSKVKLGGPTKTKAQKSTPTPTPNARSELKVGPKGVAPSPAPYGRSEPKVGPKGVVAPSPAPPLPPNGRSEPKVGPKRADPGLFFNNRPGPVHHAICLPTLPFPVHQPVYPLVGEQLMETTIGRSPIHSHGQRGGYCSHHHKNNPTQPSAHGSGFGPNTPSGTGVFIPRNNSVSCEAPQNNPGVKLQNVPPELLGTRKEEDHPILALDAGLPKDWTY